MATKADSSPYSQFNFEVEAGSDIQAGFQEISNIGMEVGVTEYRNGNDKTNNVRKITGLNKASDVTLKRGVIGILDLYKWLDTIRSGAGNGQRNVTIKLLSEDRSVVALQWRLINARIIKYTAGPLNAKSNDVAVEDITLAFERLEMPE